MAAVVARRLSRRRFLAGGLGLAAGLVLEPWPRGAISARGAGAVKPRSLGFVPIDPSTADRIMVAPGYHARPLLSWGDPIVSGARPFVPANLTAATQAKQFGYNCDYVGFFPLPAGSGNSDHGLLVVNHEFTNPELMFANYDGSQPTRVQVDVQMAAHGMSVVEVIRDPDRQWRVRPGSRYNRRLTGTSPMALSGPAAGHSWLKTANDPNGVVVLGTLGNCAGGKTPWGTVLSGEENFPDYFGGQTTFGEADPRDEPHERYGVPGHIYHWRQHYPRFDVSLEPNEPFRFGFVVEVDPYDPTALPKKRTALGRLRHEGAATVVADSGQVAVYSGDDEAFEYVYKFVTAQPFRPDDMAANRDLLDRGTLYVARFNDDGTGDWLPLVHGFGPLVEGNAFTSQATILLNARGAADLLGATKMDRPEDIEVSPVNGQVYVALTHNPDRTAGGATGVDAANPRADNQHGHVLEITENGGDHTATRFGWEVFLLCGNPADSSTYFAGYPHDGVSAISSPDNLTFDLNGNLWIATDGQPETFHVNDGLFAVPVTGAERGRVRQFLAAVPGSEVTGPEFTPDNTALFVSIQHPGRGGTYDAPLSTWPTGTLPRPSVVVVTADDGGPVGMNAPEPVPVPPPTPIRGRAWLPWLAKRFSRRR